MLLVTEINPGLAYNRDVKVSLETFYDVISAAMVTKTLLNHTPQNNLVPRAFLRRGEDGREKTLASADHVTNFNITFPTNLC